MANKLTFPHMASLSFCLPTCRVFPSPIQWARMQPEPEDLLIFLIDSQQQSHINCTPADTENKHTSVNIPHSNGPEPRRPNLLVLTHTAAHCHSARLTRFVPSTWWGLSFVTRFSCTCTIGSLVSSSSSRTSLVVMGQVTWEFSFTTITWRTEQNRDLGQKKKCTTNFKTHKPKELA